MPIQAKTNTTSVSLCLSWGASCYQMFLLTWNLPLPNSARTLVLFCLSTLSNSFSFFFSSFFFSSKFCGGNERTGCEIPSVPSGLLKQILRIHRRTNLPLTVAPNTTDGNTSSHTHHQWSVLKLQLFQSSLHFVWREDRQYTDTQTQHWFHRDRQLVNPQEGGGHVFFFINLQGFHHIRCCRETLLIPKWNVHCYVSFCSLSPTVVPFQVIDVKTQDVCVVKLLTVYLDSIRP